MIELGGGFYGWSAYKVFFKNLDPKRLTACTLYDGDTTETLQGKANHYCIAVQGLDEDKINYVKEIFSRCQDKGLLPVGRRFIERNVITQQPLVLAGEVDADGNLIVKKNSMIGEGWGKDTAWNIIKR